MATVSTFNVALVASTGRFITAIARADRQWNQFARSVQRHAKTMPEAIRKATAPSLALGRQVAKAVAVGTAALSGMAGLGVKLAAEYEQTTIAFETLLGSAEAADRFLRELDVFARRTPFDPDQLRQSARQLLAFGFAGDQVLKMLTPIGDAVAAMGGDMEVMERIIRAIGQVAAKQRVQSEELLQLTEAGIPAWRYLAEALDTTVADAMERVTKRQVDAATAINAILRGMAKDFGGAMERQSRTILGQWEQVKEGLTIITRGIGQDIIRLTGLAGAMMALNAALGRFADTVARAGSFLEALKTAFPSWLPAVIFATAGAIMGALVPAITAWLIPALKKLGTSIVAAIGPLRWWIAAGAAVGYVAWLVIQNWNKVAAGIKYAASVAAGVIVGMASTAVRAVAWMLGAIGAIIPWARGAASYLYGVSNRMDAFALRMVRAGQAAWSAAKSAKASADNLRQVKEVADGAARTTQRVGDAANRLADAADKADKAHRRLAKGLKDAGRAAARNLQSFDEVHEIETEMADSAGGAAPDIPVAKGYEDLANLLDDIANGIGDIGAATQDLAAGMEGPLGRLQSLWGGIKSGAGGAVLSIAKVAAELLALKRIAEPLSKLKPIRWTFQVVGKGIELVGRVIEWVRNLRPVRWTFEVVGKGLELVSRVAEWVRNLRPVKWVFEVVGKGIELVGKVVEWVRNLRPVRWAVEVVGNVGQFLPRVLEWASRLRPVKWSVNVGGNILEWLGKATSLFGRLGPLVSKALNPILRFVAPIGQFLLLIDVARTLLDLVQRLPGYWDELKNAIQRVVDGIQMIASGNILEGLKTAFSGVGDILVLPFKIAVQTIDSFLGYFFGQELWAKIKGWLGNIAASIGEAWNTIASWTSEKWAAITSTIGQWLDTARQWVSERWGAIKTRIGEIWDGIRQWAVDKWTAITTTIGTWIDNARTKVTTTWDTIKAAIGLAWDTIKLWALEKWTSITMTIGTWVDTAKTRVTTAWETAKATVGTIWDTVKQWATQKWTNIANTVKQWVNEAKTNVETAWNTAKSTVGGIWDTIVGWATEKWTSIAGEVKKWVEDATSEVQRMWDTAKGKLEGIWNGIKSTAVNVWSAIKSEIKGAINGIIGIINSFIRAFNRIEIRVPQVNIPLVGTVGGWSIRVPQIPEIPYLARGGDITGSGLAVVGEAGPELLHLPRGARVTPLRGGGDIEDTVYRAVYQAVHDALTERAAESDQAPEIVLRLNERTVARAILPALVSEARRLGMNLLVRPQGV